jgi:hypothetical protein
MGAVAILQPLVILRSIILKGRRLYIVLRFRSSEIQKVFDAETELPKTYIRWIYAHMSIGVVQGRGVHPTSP